MNRFVPAAPIPLLALALVAVAAPAAASTAEEFLNAPVWYLEYEVSFTSEHSGSSTDASGTIASTSKMERVFSGTEKLNLHSLGPGPLAMNALTGSSTGEQPSLADQQKLATQMMALMDHTANWLVGGPGMDEGATDAEITASMMPASPFRMDYLRVDSGKGLTDEMGEKFDLTRTTTVKGAGKVLAGGFGAVILEMDTAAKTYTLSLPIGFNAMSATMQQEIIGITQYPGSAPTEDRQSRDIPFDLFPSGLALVEEQAGGMGGGAILHGKLDPAAGRIAGEQSFKGHYVDANETTPGTVRFRYTLTMTPPKN